MFCGSCGANVGDKPINYCPACGCAQSDAPLNQNLPLVVGSTAIAKRKNRGLIWVALVSAGVIGIGAVVSIGLAPSNNSPDVNLNFTLNYPSNEQMLDRFLNGDSYDTVLQGGPYYLGIDQPGQQPIVIAYRRLKAAKVAEATRLNQEIFKQEKQVHEDILTLHAAMIELWDALQAEDSRLRRDGNALATVLLADRLKLEALLATYEALPESGNAVVAARNDYRRSALTIALAGAQASALAGLTAVALPLVSAYEKSPKKSFVDAVLQFEKRMQGMTSAAEHLAAAQVKIAVLARVIKQINTGEHFMGVASVDYTRRLLPEIQDNLRVIAGNGRASAADLDFMQANLAFQSRLFGGLEKTLAAVPTRYLLSPNELDQVKLSREFSVIMPAYAAEASAWERSIKALSMEASDTRQGLSGAVSGGWKSIKTTFQAAKGAVGFGMDGVNSAVKSGFDYAIGKWEGNIDKDIRDTIVDNFSRMEKNLFSEYVDNLVANKADDMFKVVVKE